MAAFYEPYTLTTGSGSAWSGTGSTWSWGSAWSGTGSTWSWGSAWSGTGSTWSGAGTATSFQVDPSRFANGTAYVFLLR